MRPSRCASRAISATSAGESSKSKIAKFSASRSRRLVRGMTAMPCCTRKRRLTCAAVLPCALPMRESTLSLFTPPRATGLGHDRHAVPPAGGDHLRLVDEGMHLDLVAHQRLLRELHGLLDQRDGEVRHADVARKSHTLDLAERAERVAQRNLRIRPVQQEEIDLRELQPLQARL